MLLGAWLQAHPEPIPLSHPQTSPLQPAPCDEAGAPFTPAKPSLLLLILSLQASGAGAERGQAEGLHEPSRLLPSTAGLLQQSGARSPAPAAAGCGEHGGYVGFLLPCKMFSLRIQFLFIYFLI